MSFDIPTDNREVHELENNAREQTDRMMIGAQMAARVSAVEDEADAALDRRDAHTPVRGRANSVAVAASVEPNVRSMRVDPDFNNVANARRAVKSLLSRQEAVIWRDTFGERTCVTWGNGTTDELTDIAVLRLVELLQREERYSRLSTDSISQACEVIADANKRDPVTEWLDSIKWNETARLDDMLGRGFGAEDSPYVRAVSANTMIAMVARQFTPGCRADFMVVLEGKQGIGKSTALRELIGADWFGDDLPDMGSFEFRRQLRAKVAFEIAELSSMKKAEVEQIKHVLSCPEDRYRDPYERRERSHPRRCMFIGTTNDTEYLQDKTGNRRFLPVTCGSIDRDWLAANREQLWAEAVARYKKGEPWHIVPDAQAEQLEREAVDPREAIIAEWLSNTNATDVSVEMILHDALQIPVAQMRGPEGKLAVAVLRREGWKQAKNPVARAGGKRRWWTRPDDPILL